MEMIEAVSTPMEEPPEEEPKEMATGPMIEEETTKKEAPGNTEPGPTKEMASTPKEETSVVEEKKVQSKETIKPKLAKVMAKVDEKVKNPLKNLQLKNLIKMDAMVEDQLSLDVYNVVFYAPKDIYLEQLNLIDNRLIYADKTLASYTDNDIIGIKARKLGIINNKKQQILIELETLKNG